MLPPAGTPGTDLPVRRVLGELESALRTRGAAVLVAPPGSGKTTLVPLALAAMVPGKIIVAEPRRVATRAAARRMASLLAEPLGERIGHSVRGESSVGPRTRIEVVTTGVLVRRLQRDPELRGVDALVLDECHERHLDTDLALAFAIDIRAALRPDLKVVAMSATAQAERLVSALGEVPLVETSGALHGVDIVWCPPVPPVAPPFGLQVDPRLIDHLATVIRRAYSESPGDILVFLPGVGEITQLMGRLGGLRTVPLHGRLSPRAQDEALTSGPHRRVVLATSLAESSITVPGVRAVVDAGLTRVPRIDRARGLDALVTVPVSRASAQQRAGRAGREAPGRVYRCWSSAEHERLSAHAPAEITTADLTAFALELACWGAPAGRGLTLLDPMPVAAREIADETLLSLGAIDREGRITARGRDVAAVGAHPRLARALLEVSGELGPHQAADIVALLTDPSLAGADDDLLSGLRSLRSGRDPAATARWRTEVRRLSQSLPGRSRRRDAAVKPPDLRTDPYRDLPPDLAAGLVVGLAFPERLAKRRAVGSRTYLMAGGTAGVLAAGSSLTDSPWLAVAVADRQPGRRDARIRTAVAIDEATAREAGSGLLETVDEVLWQDGDVRSRRLDRLGAIELRARPLERPDPGAVTAALRDGIRREGLELFSWSAGSRHLRARLAACNLGLGEPWPEVSDEALLRNLDFSQARSRSDLQRLDLAASLRALVPWSVLGLLDEVAPERITVPSGSAVRVDYSEAQAPTVAVKVQEGFGWMRVPQVTGRPLRLHLLSPSSRVIAVTSDLASFWVNGYPMVRAELRGRYPRHSWPEDPRLATATARVRPRERG